MKKPSEPQRHRGTEKGDTSLGDPLSYLYLLYLRVNHRSNGLVVFSSVPLCLCGKEFRE